MSEEEKSELPLFKVDGNQKKYDEYMETYFKEPDYPNTQQMLDIIADANGFRKNLYEFGKSIVDNFKFNENNELTNIDPEITFDKIMGLVTMNSIKDGEQYSSSFLKSNVSTDIQRLKITINQVPILPDILKTYFPNGDDPLSDMIFIILMKEFDKNGFEIDYDKIIQILILCTQTYNNIIYDIICKIIIKLFPEYKGILLTKQNNPEINITLENGKISIENLLNFVSSVEDNNSENLNRINKLETTFSSIFNLSNNTYTIEQFRFDAIVAIDEIVSDECGANIFLKKNIKQLVEEEFDKYSKEDITYKNSQSLDIFMKSIMGSMSKDNTINMILKEKYKKYIEKQNHDEYRIYKFLGIIGRELNTFFNINNNNESLTEISIKDLDPGESITYFISNFLDILYTMYISIYPITNNESESEKLSFSYKFIYLLASFLSLSDVSSYYNSYFLDIFFSVNNDNNIVEQTGILMVHKNYNYKDVSHQKMREVNDANIQKQFPSYKDYLEKNMEIISNINNIIINVKSTYICYDNQGDDDQGNDLSTMLAIIFVTEIYDLNKDIYTLKTNLIWLKDIDFLKKYKKKIEEYPNPNEDEKIKINKSIKILNCIISIDLNNHKQNLQSTNNPQSQEHIAQIDNELQQIQGQNTQIDNEQERQRQQQQPEQQQPSDQGSGSGPEQQSGVKNWIYNNPKKSIGAAALLAGVGLGITELVAPALLAGGRKTKRKKVFKKQTKRKKVFKKQTKRKKIFKKRSKKGRNDNSKKRK